MSGSDEVWVTLQADANQVDDAGYVYVLLDDASEPERVVPGAIIVAGDAAVAAFDGHPVLDVDRDASTLLDAIASSIIQPESVRGIQVLRVEGEELVSQADIAERTGRTTSHDMWVSFGSVVRRAAIGWGRWC